MMCKLLLVFGQVLLIGLLAGGQSFSDTSMALPDEFMQRSTVANGDTVSYRLADVSILVRRRFESGNQARLVIGGAGPTAFYFVRDRGNRSASVKLPAPELIELIDTLDLGWLSKQDSYMPYTQITEVIQPSRCPQRPDLFLTVHIGEYQKDVYYMGVCPEETVRLPEDLKNFLDQLLRGPTISKVVAEVGNTISSNSPLQPAPAGGVD